MTSVCAVKSPKPSDAAGTVVNEEVAIGELPSKNVTVPLGGVAATSVPSVASNANCWEHVPVPSTVSETVVAACWNVCANGAEVLELNVALPA